jgi:hypothetical protein
LTIKNFSSSAVEIGDVRSSLGCQPDPTRRNTMNYMLLIYEEPDAWAGASEAEVNQMMGDYFAFTQEIVDSGEMISGDPLQGVETASTVTVRGGDTIVTDGPFAETKEVLGGYYLVKVDSL